jgi:glycosyltransferase involved in cell wall biosynthesis
MKRQVTCIMPFYNEGSRLYSVLDEMVAVKNLAEIICVDDGSDDDMTSEIRKVYPQVKLVRLERNLGKSGAVREGLKYSKGDLILLFDADLRNVNHKEVEQAVEAIRKTNNIDMFILRRINAPFIIKLDRADVLFTGERILKKEDLEAVLQDSVKGWQLESAINMWMYRNEKQVYWFPHFGVNTFKPWKWGVLPGLRHDIKTFSDIISAAGFINLIKQILFFARQPLPKNEK